MNRLTPVIAAVAAFIVYFLTTCRGIWIGDTAEFALVLKSLGIAHPPGYPLFTILGTLFVQGQSFLRPVFAGGIFNAIVAAFAVGMIYQIFRKDSQLPTAFALSMIWAFTPIFWAETHGVEIYTLNVLLIASAYYFLESSYDKRWPMAIYLFGLALCNHPSALSLTPVLLLRFFTDRQHTRLRRLPIYAALLATAAFMYLYLWIRSTHDPVADWGDPEGFSALWQHMSLKQYSGWVGNSWSNVLHSLHLYGRSILECWWWPGTLLIISGTIAGFYFNRSRTINALLILATSLAMAAFHQAVNYEPFYLPALFASLLLISNNFVIAKNHKPLLRISIAGLALAAVILLIHNYSSYDKSDYTLYDDYSHDLLDAVPQGGMLFLAGDINTFGTTYLRYAEKYRTDVELYDRSIRKRVLLGRARELSGSTLDNDLSARNIILQLDPGRKYLAKTHYQNEAEWWEGLDSLYSFGLLYANSRPTSVPAAVREYDESFVGADLMSTQLLANLDLIRGEEMLTKQPPDSNAAMVAFMRAVRRYENEPRGSLLNQLGIFYRKFGYGDLALEAYANALSKPILTREQRDDIHFNISNVYKDRANRAVTNSDFEAAVTQFLKALEYDPDDPRLLFNVGLIYTQHLNDRTNAIKYLEEYLKYVPDDTRVRDLLSNLR